MKKLFVSILLVVAFISCDKTEFGSLNFVKTIAGGCALDKGSSAKNSLNGQPDAVTYSVTNDSLNILVGFNATCCSEYSTSSSIKGDSILVKIATTHIGTCDCICYYTYNFKFSGSGISYKYRVNVDDYLKFTGEIKQ